MKKKCSYCEAEFEAIKPIFKFCSEACRSQRAKEQRKQWQRNNKEKACARSKKWLEQNKERHKNWLEENKGRVKESKKQWFEQNKDKVKEYRKKWLEQNKEKVNRISRVCYYRKKGLSEEEIIVKEYEYGMKKQ